MGLFDSGNFRSKDADTIYKALKIQYQQIANPVDPKHINSKQVDVLDKPPHKQSLKTFKQLLLSYTETTVLFDIHFHDTDLTAEGMLAFLKVMSTKDEQGGHAYPISKFIVQSCRWTCGDRKPTKDFKFGSQQEESQAVDAEQSFFSLLSEYLRDTKTLAQLELNGSALVFDTIKAMIINGVRYNDSLVTLSLNDCQFDGSVQCPQLFMGVLLNLAAKRIYLPENNPLRHSEYRNMSLREINIHSKNWNSDAMILWYKLVVECKRVIRVKVALDDQNYRPSADSKPLKYYMERNHVVQGIIDDSLNKVFKRQFKTKLTNFRDSVKQHKVKSKPNSPVFDDNGPAFKWIAQSEETTNDPFHPVVSASGRFKAGYALSAGRRSEMQDVLSMQGKFIARASADSSEDFWAIFDGHGGREAASYAAENLPKLIASKVQELGNDAQPQQRADAIKQAFQECQKQMAPWNTITGTTAVCLYVHDNIRYSINLGDSRMIIYNSKAELAELLTKDHRPNVPEEAQRIQALKGGFVQDGRVNGKLQVSRSLGDSALTPYTSCIPDVKFTPITDNDEFIVLASDGLWDVFAGSGIDVAERHTFKDDGNLAIWLKGLKEVSSIVLSSQTASAAAKKLCELAYNKGSTDNISVIVVFLKFNPKKDKVVADTNKVNQPIALKDDKVSQPVAIKEVAVEKKQSQSSLNTSGFDKTQAKIANPLFNTSKVASLPRPQKESIPESPLSSRPKVLMEENSPTSSQKLSTPPQLPSRKNKRSTIISTTADHKVEDVVSTKVGATTDQKVDDVVKSPLPISTQKPAVSLSDLKPRVAVPHKPDNLRATSLLKVDKSSTPDVQKESSRDALNK